MKWLKFIILAYVAVIVQTGFVPVVFPDYLRPWTLVILANVYLLAKANEWTIVLVWLVGLLGDLTSLTPLGSQAMAYGLFGMLILTVRPLLFTDSPMAHAITSAIGVVMVCGLYAVITALTPQALRLPYSVVEVIGQALMTALLAAVINRLSRKTEKRNFAYRGR